MNVVSPQIYSQASELKFRLQTEIFKAEEEFIETLRPLLVSMNQLAALSDSAPCTSHSSEIDIQTQTLLDTCKERWRAESTGTVQMKINVDHLKAHLHEFNDLETILRVLMEILHALSTLPRGDEAQFKEAANTGRLNGSDYRVRSVNCQGNNRIVLIVQFNSAIGSSGAVPNVPAENTYIGCRRQGLISTMVTRNTPRPATDLIRIFVQDTSDETKENTRQLNLDTAYCIPSCLDTEFPLNPGEPFSKVGSAPPSEPHPVMRGLCEGTGYQFLRRKPLDDQIAFVCRSLSWLVPRSDGTLSIALL